VRKAFVTVSRSLLAAAIWMVIAYVALGIEKYRTYEEAFRSTTNGESLDVVIQRFGPPSYMYGIFDVPGKDGLVRSTCGEKCALQLWYELPFTFGTRALTVDFDNRHKVINKYEMNSP